MLALMYHVVMGDDLDVRTGKPSLDMFLAEMRRFEVLPSVKNCWNVTSLLLARSLLLAPVYCHRAAASSPEPLSSPSAAGAEVHLTV
jgi:hypothetical protein